MFDDIALNGNDSETCPAFKARLNSCFCIKDMGPLKYFLGIEVTHSSQNLRACFYPAISMH